MRLTLCVLPLVLALCPLELLLALLFTLLVLLRVLARPLRVEPRLLLVTGRLEPELVRPSHRDRPMTRDTGSESESDHRSHRNKSRRQTEWGRSRLSGPGDSIPDTPTIFNIAAEVMKATHTHDGMIIHPNILLTLISLLQEK